MARMLGRTPVPGCCAGTRAGRPPGPDCWGGGTMPARDARRIEDRELAREFAAAAAGVDLADGPRIREAQTAAAEGWPFWDFSACRHGCNGDSPCPGRCTFICHPVASPQVMTAPEDKVAPV